MEMYVVHPIYNVLNIVTAAGSLSSISLVKDANIHTQDLGCYNCNHAALENAEMISNAMHHHVVDD